MPSAPTPAAVLVVADTTGRGQALGALLAAAGHGPIHHATSTQAAISQIRRHRPDAVVIDLTTTAHAEHPAVITPLSRHHRLPIIVIGMTTTGAAAARQAGARHYLDIASATIALPPAIDESTTSIQADSHPARS